MSPARDARHTSPWLILVLVCFAQFMVILDATIVNVALPSIQTDLHFSASNLQWVINGYTLVFGGFLLLGGRAGDLIGRKRLFLAGVALFTFASLLDGLAQSSGMLIAARALQGLGAALVSPAALSIITTTFADGTERTKALGVWSGIAAGGGAVGLLLGGILTQALSWQWIFFVNVPIGIAAFVLSSRFVPESRAEKRPAGIDVAGALSVTVGLVVLVYTIVKAQSFGWGSANTLGLGAVAIALLAAFVVIERRSAAPLVRLGVFRIRSLAVANGVMLLVGSGMFAMFFFASIYAQEILGFSPIQAGLAFLPFTAGIVIGAGAAQQLIRRFGVRPVAVGGMALAAAGLLTLSRVTADGSYASSLLPGIIPMSIGMGLTFVPLTLVATTNIGNEDAGLASGIFNTAQQVGGALGLAVLSTFATSRTSNVLGGLGHAPSPSDHAAALVDGYQVAFTVGAVLVALGAVGLATLVRRRDVARINPEESALAAA
jgi:EmrB/QacA subfamily drug resistance transporter